MIINANQTSGNYWFRAELSTSGLCGANAMNGNIFSIFTYADATAGTPTSTATPYTAGCADETEVRTIAPYWDSFVPTGPLANATNFLDVNADIVGVNTNGAAVFTWGINFTSLDLDWNKPIREYVHEGNTSYPVTDNIVTLPSEGDVCP